MVSSSLNITITPSWAYSVTHWWLSKFIYLAHSLPLSVVVYFIAHCKTFHFGLTIKYQDIIYTLTLFINTINSIHCKQNTKWQVNHKIIPLTITWRWWHCLMSWQSARGSVPVWGQTSPATDPPLPRTLTTDPPASRCSPPARGIWWILSNSTDNGCYEPQHAPSHI